MRLRTLSTLLLLPAMAGALPKFGPGMFVLVLTVNCILHCNVFLLLYHKPRKVWFDTNLENENYKSMGLRKTSFFVCIYSSIVRLTLLVVTVLPVELLIAVSVALQK